MRPIDADALMEWAINIGCDGRWGISLDDLTDAIEDAQTIGPVKHGKWKVNALGSMTCTNCGWSYEHWEGMEKAWHYCPHCGARKDGEECGW